MGGFGPAAGERSGSIWRNRDFRLVWLGQTLSDLGSGVSTLAYPLLALALTRSTVQAGAVSALSTIPYLLLGLPAGALADRWDRRRLMIVCDAGSAVVLISIPVALALGHLTVEQLYATALLNGVLRVFFGAGESACLPNAVPSGRLAAAVAAQQATSAAGGVVSPSLGGALFEVLRGLPFGADAVSYLVSVVALSLVRTRFDEGGGPVRRGRLRDEIREGLAWLWSHPTIRVIAVTAAGLQLALSGVRLTVIVAAQQAHASPASIGLIFSAAGVGSVVGSALASRLSAWLGTGRTVLAVAWAQPLLWLLLTLAHGPVTIAPRPPPLLDLASGLRRHLVQLPAGGDARSPARSCRHRLHSDRLEHGHAGASRGRPAARRPLSAVDLARPRRVGARRGRARDLARGAAGGRRLIAALRRGRRGGRRGGRSRSRRRRGRTGPPSASS